VFVDQQLLKLGTGGSVVALGWMVLEQGRCFLMKRERGGLEVPADLTVFFLPDVVIAVKRCFALFGVVVARFVDAEVFFAWQAHLFLARVLTLIGLRCEDRGLGRSDHTQAVRQRLVASSLDLRVDI
jgi:hypothetical protein